MGVSARKDTAFSHFCKVFLFFLYAVGTVPYVDIWKKSPRKEPSLLRILYIKLCESVDNF